MKFNATFGFKVAGLEIDGNKIGELGFDTCMQQEMSHEELRDSLAMSEKVINKIYDSLGDLLNGMTSGCCDTKCCEEETPEISEVHVVHAPGMAEMLKSFCEVLDNADKDAEVEEKTDDEPVKEEPKTAPKKKATKKSDIEITDDEEFIKESNKKNAVKHA